MDISEFIISLDNTGSDTIATNNTAKNVDQNRFYIRIFHDDLETCFNSLRICSTTYIKEVCRLTTGKFNHIHSSHRKTSSVYHTTHVSVELYKVEVILACFHFSRILFTYI